MNATLAFRRALVYNVVVVLAVAVVGGLAAGLAVGAPGVVSALIAAAMGLVLSAITVGALLLAGRLVRDDPGNPLFVAVVLGSWLVKFALFLVAVLLLRGQDFIHPIAIFVCIVAVVVGDAVADAVAVVRARVPYIEPDADARGRRVP